jgi:HK97 family phage major capsid protein
MNRLLELKQKRAAAYDKADAIMKKAETEKRSLTAEEMTEISAAQAEMQSLKAEIAAVESVDAMRSEMGERRTSAVTVHDNREDKPFNNFGEFLQSVRNAAISPSATDPRLNPRAAALGANEGVGSEGGFLVGKDVAGKIIEEAHEVGLLFPKCSPITISAGSNAVTINGVDETSRATGSRWGGVQVYHASEAGTATATKPKFRQIELKLKKLLGFFYATDELIEDAAALGGVAERAFAEEFAFVLDDMVLRGNGAGQGLGILNSGCLVTVAKESGQAADTFVAENVSKMWQRMLPRARKRSAWYINSEVEPQLDKLNFAAGSQGGQLVYIPAGGLRENQTPMLKGRPVIVIEQANALGDVGDVILADLGYQHYASKGRGMEQASSMHVQFLTGEQTFRFTARYDMQPVLAKPITPYKGTATQSPFVVLADRA